MQPIRQHREQIVAADFFTVEVWTARGLQHVLELAARKVEIAGIAPNADGLWMQQIGCDLTDAEAGLLRGKQYLIRGRDPLLNEEFLGILAATGVKSVKLPPQSLNLELVC
jgi:hypothetical protein